ncbi:putative inhibitor of apoptosis [Leptopilina boulardi filamentous virus]|uniref:Putative inhibitor of apoptosis n=1 Tax=Leptopilina boulardi filamentous virus TaxID=552509 RepID=A0A1S5YD68_9VIRU|nr:putative inhibitor of apoptosis [Leptopilina boulardi filamentous virus]AQQ79947.1 putative inhibitor of apoptosis [Leptopilina boulardi filamentous virus]
MEQNYRIEELRLKSFEHAIEWPLIFLKADLFAKAGLYYIGENDSVKCFECNVTIMKWEEDDEPLACHKRWSARCRFIRKIACGNVPIGIDPNTVPIPKRSYDVCGSSSSIPAAEINVCGGRGGGGDGIDCCGIYTDEFLKETKKNTKKELKKNGIIKSKKSYYPNYSTNESRLITFETWPKAMMRIKEQLSNAGFFYSGNGDKVLCYQCGGSINNFELHDDPWIRHAKEYPNCLYVFLVKGQDYINRIQDLKINNLNSCLENVSLDVDNKKNDINSITTVIDNNIVTNDDGRICKICYNEEIGVVFLPCGHIVACIKCAPGMMNCPVCRKPVSMNIRTFFS